MWYQRLQRFLYGRYGTDKLNIALLISGVVLMLIGGLFFWPLSFVADGMYIFALFRTFSRNLPARQREYQAFLRVYNPAAGWLDRKSVV